MAASKLLRCFRGSADCAKAAAATREETGAPSVSEGTGLPVCCLVTRRSVFFGTAPWFFPVMSSQPFTGAGTIRRLYQTMAHRRKRYGQNGGTGFRDDSSAERLHVGKNLRE